MQRIPLFLALIFLSQTCHAWTAGGHHLVAVMAFDELTSEQQSALLEILRSHPRFEQDFKLPDLAGDPEEYLIGRSAFWPDVARNQKEHHRPSWHTQLGASLVIGNIKKLPKLPGPCPKTATLQTQELHIAQAMELCRRILNDKSQPASDRAIALCWIGHLVGDAHQPCHAGSLYCSLFPDGDKVASSIPTVQAKNLHALWDELLGPNFDSGEIKRRALEIRADSDGWKKAAEAATGADGLKPLKWLKESAEYAKSHAYSEEILKPIRLATKEKAKLEPIDLSEEYLKSAEKLAQLRAAYAAQRLAAIYVESLKAIASSKE